MTTRGEIIQAKRNLRQLFLHPRAANDEPDKVERQIFESPPCHRAVALPAGPNDEADFCVMRHFLKNLSFNFEGTFAGNGKMRILSRFGAHQEAARTKVTHLENLIFIKSHIHLKIELQEDRDSSSR